MVIQGENVKLFNEQDLIDLFAGNLAIGSKRTDFGTICEDCRLPKNGNVGLRQAAFYTDRSEGCQTITRWMNGGGSKKVNVFPTKCYNYCYYHAKQRGLLPYQQTNGGEYGKQS